MADEAREDTAGPMDQEEKPEEKNPQELSSSDEVAADELFDSFMEIANDPELQEEETDALDGVGVGSGSDPPAQKQEESNSTDGGKEDKLDKTSDEGEANASSDPSILGQNDSNRDTDELLTDAQTETNDHNKTENDLEDSLKRALDQEETVESSEVLLPVNSENEQSCLQGGDIEEGDSALSISVGGEVNSHAIPEQDATEVPSEKMATPNLVCDEGKAVDLIGKTDVAQSNPYGINETVRIEESLENSGVGNIVKATESNKNDSVDNASVSSGDAKEVDSESYPKSITADVAKSLSRAMEDLAGLEQQLCTAMTQMKQSNEKKMDEEDNKGGCVELTTLQNVDEGNKERVSGNNLVDEINNDNKGTDVDVAEIQEVEKEKAVSAEQVLPCNEDSQVEDSSVLQTSKPVDGHEEVGKEVESAGEVSNAEELLQGVTGQECKKDLDNASTEKSDSADELDLEVARSGMGKAVPDIEITTDESGISAGTEESSPNSRPGTPAPNEDGIDSDTPSDYGDDEDDNNAFVPDNLGASTNRKSWLLETDRERLSSDSSTVSERDFRESFSKGDIVDGKSTKEDYIRGHLLKMGGSGLTPKNWRKRWFALKRDNCLYYYNKQKDKAPCGAIILSNYSISKAPEINKPYCFKLTKGGARTYYMCAGSDVDMRKWMMAMMDAIKGSSSSSNPFTLSEGSVHNVSIPALSIRDPDCHGYLHKQGQGIKVWRKRYFVLKDGFLYYYSDMSNTVALGVAKLLGYTIQPGEQKEKKYFFKAISTDPSYRTYFFAAESEMDRNRWLSRLEDSIKKGSTAHGEGVKVS
ncbi:uncharacterized protein LOC111337864 [Stylophora pistillata]|uniref:Pleckstrin-likey domain-containing family A member 5 n=1 Tax=Stylophora pistillata TaxID=50429 RepID=A0A2B4RTX6_STYPI|nr:uncharacterized protein LOC111337864 [Stylophora pistillata]XP_022799968.1 uncharacterized protein LOC111337864 [Stylophora pistillata]PFX19682.1 Pleckstrin-likey domain-containing family A member 5 [Stylophora pistillata]